MPSAQQSFSCLDSQAGHGEDLVFDLIGWGAPTTGLDQMSIGIVLYHAIHKMGLCPMPIS